MKAFVLTAAGQTPSVQNFEEPAVQAEGQRIVQVTAAALNPYDRYMSNSEAPALPRVVGGEGVGRLEGGRRVYFGGPVSPYGSIAERALVAEDNLQDLPPELSDEQALTLGTSGKAGWLPLSWKARLQKGESVLILGATGAQGQIAVQAAKLLGAGHVVAAGRNQEVLHSLRDRGADATCVLEGDIAEALRQAAPQQGYDVVIDSLFGEPFARLLESETLSANSRVVVLGGSAGQDVNLSFRSLQGTKGATIAGYSTFYVPKDVQDEAFRQMVQHALRGELKVATASYPLDEAAKAWQTQAAGPHQKIIIIP